MNALTAQASQPEPDYAEIVVEDIRSKIQVDLKVIKEARKRREIVKAAAAKYVGVTRTFNSGSIAHWTAKKPLPDADCGGVLDRRKRAELGPDSSEQGGSTKVVKEVAALVLAEVRKHYPNATVDTSGKRAIVVTFNEEVHGEDPQVDLIVALTRRDKPGLWIPNLKTDSWDASDPEKHTELLTGPPKSLRVYRARLIRLAKVAIEQDGQPVLISFNVEALALKHVRSVSVLADGLRDLFADMATSIAAGDTPDPAGVSPPVKLPKGIDRDRATRRLRFIRDRLTEAVENRHDEAAVKRALADVFPDQLPDAQRSSKSQLAEALRHSSRSPRVQAALGVGAERAKDTSAYGDAAA